MSLQDKKKLADLKSEAEEFYGKRNAVRTEKLKEAIEAVKKGFISYLSEEGFTYNDKNTTQVIEASYKNDIFLYLKYGSPEDRFFGASSVFEVGEQNADRRTTGKKVTFSMSMQQEDIPHFSYMGTSEGKMAKELAFYEETLLPALKSLGTSDITGEYVLSVRNEANPRKIIPQTIPEIIEELMK
ncbi:hypothetical protein [Aliivibrio salmonicida]|uniref:hypothetical protein n=1 Tax=Aliivibrio salmonicida TaxID=40269 RepID=UPI003D10BDDC